MPKEPNRKTEPKAAPKAAEPKAQPKAEPKAAPKAAEPKAEPKAQPKPRRNQPGQEQAHQARRQLLRPSNAPRFVRRSSAKATRRVTNVNFSLTVGTVVPRTVRIVVLPPRVVEIYPAWPDTTISSWVTGSFVEPDTLRIVFIIDA